jgi:hypothetical protein
MPKDLRTTNIKRYGSEVRDLAHVLDRDLSWWLNASDIKGG